MIYDCGSNRGDGQWHCPFTPSWVDRMRKAAAHCKHLSGRYIDLTLKHEWMIFCLPPGDFLSEQQDARGLPLSWCEEEHRRLSTHPTCCLSIYDYNSIPEVVVTDGYNDYPLELSRRILTA